MFILETDNQKIGEYLKLKIHQKYPSTRQFCKAYQKLRDKETSGEEIRKLNNRFSQILKGIKRVQIDDLPYITELLDISCEEILSAGKNHVPLRNHMTNYTIAASRDPVVWNRYMKHKDNLFLNSDEYGKTVIDYAFEFKNYPFIKYLLNEEFIWFVDVSDKQRYGANYGADTSVKRREFTEMDTDTGRKLSGEDDLRIKMITLAIENEDIGVLDSLLARQIPEMNQATVYGNCPVDLQKRKNEQLIHAIASASKRILDYFSGEFVITDISKKQHTVLFPYYADVIENLLALARFDAAKDWIRKAIAHNRSAAFSLQDCFRQSLLHEKEFTGDCFENHKQDLIKSIFSEFRHDENSDFVSFVHYTPEQECPEYLTNLVRVRNKTNHPEVKELLSELEASFEDVLSLEDSFAC